MGQPGHAASTTVEVRWWWPGPVSDDLDAWYASLGPHAPDTTRTDRYLLSGSSADRNIKARHGSTLEVKRRLDVAPLAGVVPGLDGSLERWRKWPMAPAALRGDGAWATVRKHRRLREEHGCSVELADVRLEDERWATLSLEADEPGGGLDALVASLEALRTAGLQRRVHLTRSASRGYPQHLLTVLGRRRTHDRTARGGRLAGRS